MTGTGTAQLPEKVRRNPEQMREGDPKKRRSYERKFKQISGTAAVGVHDHEPDCQRISRYAGKSSTDAEEAPQSEETAETAEPETTPAETESSESTAETPAEEPTETPAAPAEDQTPAGSDETETPSADEDASEDTAEDTAKDGEETADTTEKEPEAADETSQDAEKETPAKEETKDAVKENTSPAAEQPKTEVKETTKNEASNTAEEKETKAAEAAKPADGEYETSAEATGSMFRVISSRLIVKDGKLKASILLSGTGYDYLYTGTAAEAAAADEKSWIAPTGSETYTDTKTGAEKTGYRFEIPVEELDKQMDVAVRSAKKKTWTDKTVTIHSTAAIPTVTPEPTETPSENPGEDSSNKPASVEAPVTKEDCIGAVDRNGFISPCFFLG